MAALMQRIRDGMEQSTVLGAFAGSDTTLTCRKLEKMAQRDNGNLLAGLYEPRGLTLMSGMVIITTHLSLPICTVRSNLSIY